MSNDSFAGTSKIQTMITEDLKIIKEFNRNIAWLKAKEMKPKNMVTAKEFMEKTGWNKEQLRRKRALNQIRFERTDAGSFRYEDTTQSVSILPASLS